MNLKSLNQLVDVFHKITDPLDAKGVRHDFYGMFILVFLGQLAQIPYIAQIWHWRKGAALLRPATRRKSIGTSFVPRSGSKD